MIGSSKQLASLSSGLLARKGQARPAMRPQGFVGVNPAPQEDLGWNDMGEESLAYAPAPNAPAAPMPQPVAVVQPAEELEVPAAKPEVLRQREVLDAQIAEPKAEVAAAPVSAPVPAPASVTVERRRAPRVPREPGKTGKAAFTLRLDAERHLRLRLASAVTRRSAQQIVTEALDQFLESLGEVEALARQVAVKNAE